MKAAGHKPERPIWVPIVLVIGVLGLTLYLMGRTFWCSCGGLSPWSWQVNSLHNSQHLIDPYTFTHVLHGLVFYAALWGLGRMVPDSVRESGWASNNRWGKHGGLLIACVIEALWEVLENTPLIIERYRAATISLDYYGDSIANSISDVIACLLGFVIASRLQWYYSVALFIVVEVVLLLTIRDSLMLNVIMLLVPSDAILQWQSA